MTTPNQFFEKAQPAAILKHGILSRYFPVFAWRAGSISPNNHVAYIDGYAGPGQYQDGQPGSPALAVETARAVLNSRAGRLIDGYLVERDKETYELLVQFIAEEAPTWRAFHGEVEGHLPEILGLIHPATPLFAFFDPFGLGVPADQIKQIMRRGGTMSGGFRSGGTPTEVLLNFSYPGLRRNAGHLTSESADARYMKARATILERVDSDLGGDWWREIWIAGAEGREQDILRQWLALLCEGPGAWAHWAIPISDRWMGPPDYALVLLTQHEAGLWHFNEALSSALEPYRERCLAVAAQLDLEPLAPREELWVAEIKTNLEELLQKGAAFRLSAEMFEVYGAALGWAREKHIRTAVKELHKEGKTATDGKGKVQEMVVKPTQPAAAK